jgi:hypothetical protein
MARGGDFSPFLAASTRTPTGSQIHTRGSLKVTGIRVGMGDAGGLCGYPRFKPKHEKPSNQSQIQYLES